MHRNLAIAGVLACLVTAVVTGCGGASADSSDLNLRSAAVGADGVVRPNYSCGNGTLWLPLEWDAAPEGTKELAILIGRYRYENADGGKRVVVPFGDLVSHIKPSKRRNPSGVFPAEALYSAFGPVSCPRVRRGQHIIVQIYALDTVRYRELTPRLATRLTEEALESHGSSARDDSANLTKDAIAVGSLLATYGSKPAGSPE